MPYSEYKYRNDCKSNTNWLNLIYNLKDGWWKHRRWSGRWAKHKKTKFNSHEETVKNPKQSVPKPEHISDVCFREI